METYNLGHKFQVGIFTFKDKKNNLQTLQYFIPNLKLVVGYRLVYSFSCKDIEKSTKIRDR